MHNLLGGRIDTALENTAIPFHNYVSFLWLL